MSTLVALYRDISLLLDMLESRIKAFKELYERKIDALTPVGNEDKEDYVGNAEPARRKYKVKMEPMKTVIVRVSGSNPQNFITFN